MECSSQTLIHCSSGLFFPALPSLSPAFSDLRPGSCILSAIEPESGAGTLQLRFIVYVLLLLFFGFLIPLPSSPFYEIRDASFDVIGLGEKIERSHFHQTIAPVN